MRASSGSGVGASAKGFPSVSTLVARRDRVGRSAATVQPYPVVYQAFCFASSQATAEVEDLPARLTYPVRYGTSGLGGMSSSGVSRPATRVTAHELWAA